MSLILTTSGSATFKPGQQYPPLFYGSFWLFPNYIVQYLISDKLVTICRHVNVLVFNRQCCYFSRKILCCSIYVFSSSRSGIAVQRCVMAVRNLVKLLTVKNFFEKNAFNRVLLDFGELFLSHSSPGLQLTFDEPFADWKLVSLKPCYFLPRWMKHFLLQ